MSFTGRKEHLSRRVYVSQLDQKAEFFPTAFQSGQPMWPPIEWQMIAMPKKHKIGMNSEHQICHCRSGKSTRLLSGFKLWFAKCLSTHRTLAKAFPLSFVPQCEKVHCLCTSRFHLLGAKKLIGFQTNSWGHLLVCSNRCGLQYLRLHTFPGCLPHSFSRSSGSAVGCWVGWCYSPYNFLLGLILLMSGLCLWTIFTNRRNSPSPSRNWL